MFFQARHSLPRNLPSSLTAPSATIFCNMHYNGNRLLIAGGDLNYNSINREGTIMITTTEHGIISLKTTLRNKQD